MLGPVNPRSAVEGRAMGWNRYSLLNQVLLVALRLRVLAPVKETDGCKV